MTEQVPVIFVGPGSGYAPGGRLFIEMLGRERVIREAGISDFDSPSPAKAIEVNPEPGIGSRITLRDQIGAAIDDVTRGHPSETPPALIGYSLGAIAAAEYAAEFPGTVSSLVLAAPWVRTTEKMAAAARLWSTLHVSGEPTPRREEALLASRLVLVSSRGWRSLHEPRDVRPNPAADADIEALLEGCVDVDIEATASRIVDPTLVVACALDEFADPTQSHLLFGAIRDARLAEIESGHAVLLERPAELLDAVESFIANPRRHPAGARIGGRRP